MQTAYLSEFQKLHGVFRIREEELPQETRGKLLYIASRIKKQPFNSTQFYDEKSEEARQIAHLDENSLVILFTTIVKTLLIEKKSLQRQCKIKYTGFFEMWRDAKAFINQEELILTTQKFVNNYSLISLNIGNKRKTKNTFDLYQKEKLVVSIKFLAGQIYQQFSHFLESRIEEKQSKYRVIQSIHLVQKQSCNSIAINNISSKEKYEFQKIIRNSRDKQYLGNEQMNFIENMIKKQFKEGYSIVNQSENMCMFLSKTQPRIHINLLVKSILDIKKIINYYIHQQDWCSSVISEYIIELEQNNFQVFRIFKNDSFFNSQRGTLTKLNIFCAKNIAQVTEETINCRKKDNKLICSVSSHAKFYKCLNGIKIFIDCSFDGKGYYSMKDSCLFLIKWFRDIEFFENSYKLSQMQKNIQIIVHQDQKLLLKSEKQSILRNYKQPFNKVFFVKQKSLNKQDNQNMGTLDTMENQKSKNQEDSKDCLFFELKPLKPTCIPSLDYVRLVTKQFHHRYYLHSRFDQSIFNNYDDQIPPYILSELLKRKEFKISENKQLVFINRQVIESQKGSLLFVIKQVGANIVSGKSVLNVSLPVDIFEPRTLLERSASSFGLVPDYLIPVADANPLTQIKNITTLFANIPTLELVMLKPFNPILGQTFQAYIKGIPIYYEQTSHHPPISSFYMTCPEFTMYGNLVAFADLSLNSAVGGNEGITYIKMRNGSEFQCYFPPCQISGLIFGDRSFRAYGKGYILEKNTNLFAEISIQDSKKGLYEKGPQKLYPGNILGGIFKIKPEIMQHISKQKSLRKFNGLKTKDVVEKLCDIRGTWFEQIRINNQLMNRNKRVYPLQYPKITLPSDANYRLDVLYHKVKDINQSQIEKIILEQRQRKDRKLREKGAKILSNYK